MFLFVETPAYPTYVFFTETFLNHSKPAKLPDYELVSRSDLRTEATLSRIMLFALTSFEKSIVHVGDSYVHECWWYIVRSERGPIWFGLQYKRPAHGEIESIDPLYNEVSYFDQRPCSRSYLTISKFARNLGYVSLTAPTQTVNPYTILLEHQRTRVARWSPDTRQIPFRSCFA